MGTTVIAAGQRIDCRGTYDDVTTALATPTLTPALRELVTTDGEKVTVNVAAVALVRENVAATPKRKVGFA